MVIIISAISKLMNKSFLERLISGIVLVIVAIVTITFGGNVLFATTLIISLIGLSEMYNVLNIRNSLIAYTGYAATIAFYAFIRFGMEKHLMPLFIAFLLVVMAVYVFTFPKYTCDKAVFVFFGLFYVSVMLSYIYQLRMMEDGIYLVWLIFLCSWGCDTCAYLAGVMFGKHKMAPVLSPKKSIEGAVGGVVGAALLGFIYATLFKNNMGGMSSPQIMVPVTCAVAGLISMVGDLAASGIKRNYDIKDYGKLIPGHGGILDRFDSVIFTAPIIYYLIQYMQ